MKLSTTTEPLYRNFGLKTAIDILAESGYDAIDFSQTAKDIYEDVCDVNYYSEIRKYAESKGLYFNQSHAPFHSSSADEQWSKKRFDEIALSIKRASLLGVENLVVHPCQHLIYDKEGNPERLFEYNMKFYGDLVPYAEEYGVHIALENMWQSVGDIINHSTCSTPEEFVAYLDELSNPCFVACLDIGHGALVREDMEKFIKALGSQRLKALHVHDVNGNEDLHTLPFYGSVNWEKVMKALKDIGYTGDFTFEADHFISEIPKELMADGAKFMCSTGKYLIRMFDEM